MTQHAVPDNTLPEGATAVLEKPEYRVEGPLKVTGRVRYTGDVRLPGMLYARYAISPVPHARIVSIDTSAAKQVPGVHAVLTGQDIGMHRFGRALFDWPVLAVDKVRFIGDRVAAVAAETEDAAEEAVRLIDVEYEELPAVLDPLDALKPDAPILHEHPEEYAFSGGGERPPRDHLNLQGQLLITKGDPDIERVFAQCDYVFEHTFRTSRQHAGYIEPHGAVVWLEGDTVKVISTNKSPFAVRQQMSICTGVPVEKIEVDNWFIGGDFGGKGLSVDEFAAYYLAKATGRPVKGVMSYVDDIQATNVRHRSYIRLRTGVTKEGRILAHECDVIFDGGAYAAGKPGAYLQPGAGLASYAAYDIPNTRLDSKTAYTNTVPGGHNRAPAEVQTLFASESQADMIADALGMDPVEFRLLNAQRPGSTGPSNEHFREVRAVEVLEALRDAVNWGKVELPPNRGRGIALGVRHVGGGKTSLDIKLCPDGTFEVVTAVPDQGSGSFTVIRRVAASVLGVEPERIAVTHGTTAQAPFDPGSGASRVTHIVGQAARIGAMEMKARLEELASEVMGWPAGRVSIQGDRFVVTDGSGEGASFADVAQRIAQTGEVTVRGSYNGEHGPDDPIDFNYFAYMIEVEVDPETGQFEICDAVLSLDAGTIINPIAHQGQIDGGFVFGLGNTTMEEIPDESGKLLALNLSEYKLPTIKDIPPFRTVIVPTRNADGPFGAKMAGEVSNSGVGPAVGNAIARAVGARVYELPITAERVFEALNGIEDPRIGPGWRE